jgi:acyl carrier protein
MAEEESLKATIGDVELRVREIIIEHIGCEEHVVTDDAHFINDLGADSLDTVELVMAFEEEFSLDIPEEDAENIQTVGDVHRYVQEYVKNSGIKE